MADNFPDTHRAGSTAHVCKGKRMDSMLVWYKSAKLKIGQMQYGYSCVSKNEWEGPGLFQAGLNWGRGGERKKRKKKGKGTFGRAAPSEAVRGKEDLGEAGTARQARQEEKGKNKTRVDQNH